MSEAFRTEWKDGVLHLEGRFDASQAGAAEKALDQAEGKAVLDFAGLQYISSAGLGVLLAAQKRLSAAEGGLKLVNMNDHIRELFQLAGFDMIFEIE